MAGKLTVIFAKKEAETYNSQGLHQEALAIYKKLLSSSPDMEKGFKDSIQGRIEEIKCQLNEVPSQEGQRLSLADIIRIRNGWANQATEGDLLVCAKAFCHVGHYRYALKEVVALIHKGCAPDKVVGMLADCLVHLHTPEKLTKALDVLAPKLAGPQQAALDTLLHIGREMVRRKELPHAAAICQYMQNTPGAQDDAPDRLAALADEIESLQAEIKAAGAKRFKKPPALDLMGGGKPGAGKLFAAMKRCFRFAHK